jgi:hypothetical protein
MHPGHDPNQSFPCWQKFLTGETVPNFRIGLQPMVLLGINETGRSLVLAFLSQEPSSRAHEFALPESLLGNRWHVHFAISSCVLSM